MKGVCHHCGCEFNRDADQIRRAKFSFCSVACKQANPDFNTYAAHRNGDKQRGRGARKAYRKLYGRHEHRVVAEAKLGRSLLPGEIVHHKDGNKLNNTPENLEVMTQSEHMRVHTAELSAAKKNPARGSRSGMAKLTEASVLEIRKLAWTAATAWLADRFGVSSDTIRRVVTRRAWTHV